MADPITIEWICERLKEAFPGVKIHRGGSLNGEAAGVVIWEFHINCSVITKKVTHVDSPGECVITFWHKPEGQSKIDSRYKQITSDRAQAEAFILWCRSWIMGVVYELHKAFTPPPEAEKLPEGVAGLFYGDPDEQSTDPHSP